MEKQNLEFVVDLKKLAGNADGDVNLRFGGHVLTITTNHPRASYDHPVILHDGILTDAFYTGETVQPPQDAHPTYISADSDRGPVGVTVWTTCTDQGQKYIVYALGYEGLLGTVYQPF